MGKYNSLGIYKENINVFWSVYPHNECFFDIGRTAGTGGQGDKRRDSIFIFSMKAFQVRPGYHIPVDWYKRYKYAREHIH